MYNSPTRPAGTSSRWESSTNTWVFAIGRPMATGASADVIRSSVDQTVVSVGPYRFHNSPHRVSKALARSRDSASPPHNAIRPGDPVHPAPTSEIGRAHV